MDSKFDADSDGTFRITRKTIFDMNTEKRKPHKLEFIRGRRQMGFFRGYPQIMLATIFFDGYKSK